MTRDELVSLLSIAAAYDGRTLGESDVAAWGDAAERGRWTYAQSQDAVKAHYAESTAWLMPGHVTERIRAERSEPPRSHALPQATPTAANREHTDRCVSWLEDRLAENESSPSPEDRHQAYAIPCPQCGAKANRSCWQTTWNGTPLARGKTMSEPHRDRLKAAQTQE